MKRRWRIITLTSLVLLIWSAVISRIRNNHPSKESVIVESGPTKNELQPTTDSLDVFYRLTRDPFLSGTQRRNPDVRSLRQSRSTSPRPTSTSTASNNSMVIWPNIKFDGFVADRSTTGERIAIIVVDDVTHLVNEGDTVRGMKVISVENTELVLESKSEIRKIKSL